MFILRKWLKFLWTQITTACSFHCTEKQEILNGKLHFLCSVYILVRFICYHSSFSYLLLMSPLYTSWKHKKTSGILMFPGGTESKIGLKGRERCLKWMFLMILLCHRSHQMKSNHIIVIKWKQRWWKSSTNLFMSS